MRFDVYLNRRAMGRSRKRVYSIRNSNRVVTYTNSTVLLSDVELVVQPSGRAETLERTQQHRRVQKTVHAFLRGDLLHRGRNVKPVWNELLGKQDHDISAVGYDPHKTCSWVKLDDYRMPELADGLEHVVKAKYAYLHQDGILVAH